MQDMFTLKNGMLQFNGEDISSGLKISKKAFRNIKYAENIKAVIVLLKKMDIITSVEIRNDIRPNTIQLGKYQCHLW